MSKIGISTPRKTKYKPASNNPFQGPTTVSFNANRTPFPSAFSTFIADPTQLVKNSMLAFNIERVGGVNRYGDNSRLRMQIANAQLLSEEVGINLNFGVNNNAALAATDGITVIEVQVFGGKGDIPIACLGPAAELTELSPNATGIFTKATAAALPEPVTLRDGDNFKFSLQQAVEATGVGAEEATGTLYIVPQILENIREPGSMFILNFRVNMLFTSQLDPDTPVALENAVFQLYLFNTEE